MNAKTPTQLPIRQAFELSAAGHRELGRIVSPLTPLQLELLLRTDGTKTLAEVRAEMPAARDEQFTTAFQVIWQRGLVCESQKDRFTTTSSLQLNVLAASLGQPIDVRTNTPGRQGFSVGLVWRRPASAANETNRLLTAVVVEDDPVLARFVQCFLAMEGFQVRLAANRAEVVAGFRTAEPPDLVLLDVQLPDADGFDVLRKLRAHPRLQHVPVIMLTGCATRQGVLQALEAGANGYLTKPFDAEVLTQAARAVTGLDGPGPDGFQCNPWANGDALPERASRRAA